MSLNALSGFSAMLAKNKPKAVAKEKVDSKINYDLKKQQSEFFQKRG
jgi:hypothetical protein